MMFLHTRTGCVKPQLSNRVVPGPKRAGDQPTIRVRVRSRGTNARLPEPTAWVDWWRWMSAAAMEIWEVWWVRIATLFDHTTPARLGLSGEV